MGLDVVGINFLLSARARGTSFERTMTLGRQNMHAAPDQLREALERFGAPRSAADVERLCPPGRGGFCEPFLREVLGAAETSSMDVSDFEGATHLHDLNLPVPEAWRARFSAVVDAGTLEHVFDFRQGISNAMTLVERGGRLLAITPANNACGHGFYQFSPDLFFRVLSPENGFRMERLYLVEYSGPAGDWYEIADPATAGAWTASPRARVAYLLAQAVREEIVPLFRSAPRQSVYVPLWSGAAEAPASAPRPRLRRALAPLAAPALRAARRAWDRVAGPLASPPHGRRVALDELGRAAVDRRR